MNKMQDHDLSTYKDLNVLQLTEIIQDRDIGRTELGTLRSMALMALKWANYEEHRALLSKLEAKEAVTVTPERVPYETGEV